MTTTLQPQDEPTIVSALWVDPATLDDPRLQEVALDDVALRLAVLRASEILYVASGRRWSGGLRTRTVFVEMDQACGPSRAARTAYLFGSRPAGLTLPDYPVVAVNSVKRGDDDVDSGTYELRDGRTLHRATGWPSGTYEVEYAAGSVPPAAGRAAAAVYAIELYLAAKGSSGCRLPKRVSSITRQNVTMTLLDPMEFLDKGRTGVVDVDAWLVNINPTGARSRPVVWSPDTHQPTHTR